MISDAADRKALLGLVLGALLATTGQSWAAVDELPVPAYEALQEIAKARGLSLDDHRDDVRDKLLAATVDSILQIGSGDLSPHDATIRIGREGLLSPGSYDVHIGAPLKEKVRLHGLTTRRIEEAIQSPDAYQHLFSPEGFGAASQLVSVYVKVANLSLAMEDPRSTVWNLVLGVRQGDNVLAVGAWRVRAKDLEIDPLSGRPLDLLKAFVARFGLDIRVFGRDAGKFLLYASRPTEAGHELFSLASPAQRYDANFLARRDFKGETQIAIAFAIDEDRYLKSLMP